MVKLVCFDVDNTILGKGEKSVSADILHAVKALISKGVLVAVASGRPLCDLIRLFSEVIGDIILISYDGSLAVYKNSAIIDRRIDKDLLYAFVDTVKAKCVYEYAAYGAGCVYVNSQSGSSSVSMQKAGTMEQRIVYVDDFHKITEPVYKVSAFIEQSKDYDYDFFISEWESYLKNIYTGNGWCEFIGAGNDKGSAVRILCEMFSIDRSEVMAFGDGANDITMLEFAEFSYAVNAASSEVASAARYTSADVVKTLKSFFEI